MFLFCFLLCCVLHTLSALTPRENNQLWLQVRRARKSCQPVLTACDRNLRGEDNENCINQCVSSACYEQIYASEPLELGEIDYKRTKAFMRCVYFERLEQRRQSWKSWKRKSVQTTSSGSLDQGDL